MTSYVERLTEALSAEGMRVPPYITESNGGVMGARQAATKAVHTLFSGPVGGVVGTRAAGESVGLRDLISVDVGGTSFDVSIVRGGEATLQSEFELQGLPVLAPAVEVHTIGAGGGSLIREAGGALKVGPESAGAEPGPACYGLGGTEPTVTDANLLLGRIPAEQRLAGSMPLDLDAARRALQAVGDRFDLRAEEIAEQALAIVHFAMAEAIRELTVERGLDPRDFVLCAFGGAGGLHATALADELEIDRVLVPAMPGAFSAWGMLEGDVRHDAALTFYRSLRDTDGELPRVVGQLEQEVAQMLQRDGIGEEAMRFEVAADLRYVGQEYTLTVPLAREEVDGLAAHREAVASRFHDAYKVRYGHASASEPIEFVALRLTGHAELGRGQPTANGVPKHSRMAGEDLGTATMWIEGQPVQARLYDRRDLDRRIAGPAILLEETATTVVPAGWRVTPSRGAHLLLERG